MAKARAKRSLLLQRASDLLLTGNFALGKMLFSTLALFACAGFALIGNVEAQTTTENWREALIEDKIASIVSVLPQVGGNRVNANEPEGTGVAIDGYILTADHVLGNANRILIRAANGDVSEANIYLRDKATDLALLKPSAKFNSLSIASENSRIGIGHDVCVIGNAFGLGLTLSCGVVSANEQRGIGFNFVEDFIQIDAAVNPGMSGAPLFNDKAEMVGLVTAIFTKQSDGNLGVNFAASSNLISAFLSDAKDGKLDRAKAGIVMQKAPLPGETGRAGGLIKAVASNSIEEQSGLLMGDLVLSANAIKVRGQADYLAALVLAGEDGQIRLQISREGLEQTIEYKVKKTD